MDSTTLLNPMGQVFFETRGHGDGSQTHHDSMGRLVARFTPHVGGGGTLSDPMGHVLERVQEFGGVTRTLDPLGALKYTERQLGGQSVLQNAIGQTLLRQDPLSGNITNALGMLVARQV